MGIKETETIHNRVKPKPMTLLQAVKFLGLPTSTKTALLKDIREGRFTQEKVIGMVEVIQKLTGKYCSLKIGLYIKDHKYTLEFKIDDMHYTLVY